MLCSHDNPFSIKKSKFDILFTVESRTICLCVFFISLSAMSSKSIHVVVFIVESLLCVCAFSHVQLFATPWTVAPQAPMSMEFSRQES